MARKFETGELVIASHNAGKVREIGELLRPLGVVVSSASSLELPEPEETGHTFVANAHLKASAAATATGLPALGDDSGVVVSALDGEPGIYTARWAGPERDWRLAMEKVQTALSLRGEDVDRRASFVCALVLCWPDGDFEAFEAEVRGELVWPPRGELGNGFEPMFAPEGQPLTYGEMDPAAKLADNHRARAVAQLLRACF